MSTAPESDPFLGQVIAERYAISRRIGRGGMGAVYLARQHPLGRDVALKVIRADLAHDPEVVGRFEREAKAIALLSDPHIVVVHDFGHAGNTLYLAMELLNGMSLGERLRTGGPVPLASALRITRDICGALDVAHKAGVIHRDLKPDNIMLVNSDGRSDYAKVLDFGIAKITGGPDAALTSSRTVLGTPGYVAPDVIMSGMTDDPRSDLYAVGVMLFEMLAGRAPFQTTSAGAMLVAQASNEAPLVSSLVVDVPAPIVELVRVLTSRKPEGRPPSARFVIETIDAFVTGQPTAPLFGGLATMSSSAPRTGPTTMPLSQLAGGVAVRETLPTPTTMQLERSGPAMVAPAKGRTVPVGVAAAIVVGIVGVVIGAKLLLPSSTPTTVVPPVTQPAVIATAPVTPPLPVTPPVVPVVAAVAPVAPVEPTPPVAAVVEPAAVEPVKPVVKAAKPKAAAVVDAPPEPPKPVGPAPPTSAFFKTALAKNFGKAPTCQNTNIKGAESGTGFLIDHCPSYKTVDGTRYVSMMIAPSGEVLSATFTDDDINKKSIAACVLSSIKGWKVPPFAGTEPVEVKQRVVFETCIPINGVCVF